MFKHERKVSIKDAEDEKQDPILNGEIRHAIVILSIENFAGFLGVGFMVYDFGVFSNVYNGQGDGNYDDEEP